MKSYIRRGSQVLHAASKMYQARIAEMQREESSNMGQEEEIERMMRKLEVISRTVASA